MATTTTATFGGLSVPAHEDSMEVSSPAPQQHFDNNNINDDDFDIDFDDYGATANTTGDDQGGGVHLSDDEYMVEDGNPLPADEMMDDDDDGDDAAAAPGHQEAEEQTMQDDLGVNITSVVSHEQDEELLDYGEGIDQADGVQLHLDTEHVDVENGEAATLHVTVDDAANPTGERTGDEVDQEDDQLPPRSDYGDDELSAKEKAFEKHIAGYVLPNDSDYPEDLQTDLPTVPASPGRSTYENVEHEATGEGTNVDVQSNAPATPTDTGLHPMEVRYGDMQMPLFKSRHQPDGLLKDDNLASLSLAELITSARQRLALKIGEDISEDQELVLGFDRLGLILVENSRPAFESSLNEILEVFLQLHYNDQTQEIPPLSLTFSLQLKFTSSLATLKQAAAGGQGISSFSFLASQAAEDPYLGDDYGNEDADGDEYDDGEYHDEEENQQQRHDEANYVEASGEAEQYETAQQQGGEVDNVHDQEEQFEEYEAGNGEKHNENYEGGDAVPQEIPQENEGAATEAVDQFLDHYHEATDNGVGDHTAAVLTAPSEGDKITFGEENPISHGEKLGSHAVGEYDNEDLIDWDSDDLITDSPDTSAIGHSDLPTSLSDERVDAAELATEPPVPETETARSTHNEFSDYLVEHQDESSGGLVDNFDETHVEIDNFVDESSYQGGYDAEEQFDDEYNAIDTSHEQQDVENQLADHTDTAERQFHTAENGLNDLTNDHEQVDDTYEYYQPDETAGMSSHSHPEGGDHLDFGDDLEYEDEGNDEAVEPRVGLSQIKSGSPLGKRSFEEHIESDLFDDDEPDLKKAKPS